MREINVIWRRGDGEMPEKVKQIVNAAQDELLRKRLRPRRLKSHGYWRDLLEILLPY